MDTGAVVVIAGLAAWGAVGAVAAGVGVGWGRAVAKHDPIGTPCPSCDGAGGLPAAVLPWRVPRRCPGCSRTVREPTLLIEGGGALALVALAASGEGPGVLAARAWLATVLAALVWTDARYRLLPGPIVWIGGVASVVLLGLLGSGAPGGSLPRSLVAAAGLGAVVLSLHLLSPQGLAYGDVRLCVLLGLHLGWSSGLAPAWALVLAAAAGAGWGLLGSGGDRSRTVPFGPFLAVATVVVLVVNPGG